jgi:hypothetical protein
MKLAVGGLLVVGLALLGVAPGLVTALAAAALAGALVGAWYRRARR